MSDNEMKPIAVLRREIGENTWFDWYPIRPGCRTHIDLQKGGGMDYCEVYALPAAIAATAPVAWGVQKDGEAGVWFVSDSRFTAQHYAQEYAHRTRSGETDQAVIPLYTRPALTDEQVREIQEECAKICERIAQHERRKTEWLRSGGATTCASAIREAIGRGERG